jgi:hypothetical protein
VNKRIKNIKPLVLAFLALALFLIATNVQAGLLFVISAGLAGLFVVSLAVPSWSMRKITVERANPPSGTEGEDIHFQAEIANSGRAARFMIGVTDPLARGGGGAAAVIPAGLSASVSYAAALPRGVYRSIPLVASCGFPFGIFSRQKSFTVPADLTIYPDYEDIRGLPLLEAASTPSEAYHERRTAGAGTDYLGVRDFRPGDSLKVIHWRTSARRGELTVKEFEEETASPVVIYIDESRDAGQAGDSMLDAAARIAASIAGYCLKAGHPVRLLRRSGVGSDSLFNPGLTETLGWLAALRRDSATTPDELVAETVLGINARSTVIMVAPAEKTAWDSMAAAVQGRRARFIAVLMDEAGFQKPIFSGIDVHEIARGLAGKRAAVYLYRKGDSIRTCLSAPLSVTGE